MADSEFHERSQLFFATHNVTLAAIAAIMELERGGLYPPIERTMLTIIAAMAASLTLCMEMKS